MIPLAHLLLGEPVASRHVPGSAVTVTGLAVMFNPVALNYAEPRAVLGNGLLPLALLVEGVPDVEWTLSLCLLVRYGGVCTTALASWAMTMVNRSLPAAATSLGFPATPIVGTLCAALTLGGDDRDRRAAAPAMMCRHGGIVFSRRGLPFPT